MPDINNDNDVDIDVIATLKEVFYDSTIANFEKINLFYKIVESFFHKIIYANGIDNTSVYSIFLYIFKKFGIDKVYLQFLRMLYWQNKNLRADSTSEIPESTVNEYYHIALALVSKVLNSDIEQDTLEIINDFSHKISQMPAKREDLLLSIITSNEKINNDRRIIAIDSYFGEFELKLKDDWVRLAPLLSPNLRLNLFKVEIINQDDEIVVVCDKFAYLVVEPDYLIDITDVSRFSEENGFLHYFVNRYISKNNNSEALLVGNIVNNMFDELLVDSSIPFMELLESSVKNRLMSFLLLIKNDNFRYKEFSTKIQIYYNNILQTISKLEKGDYSTEATFIAPDFGIQGRLDLLIENTDENENKNIIIELKTGKAPDKDYLVVMGKQKIKAGVWGEHLFQIAGYNLLLAYAFDSDRCITCLLYSSDIRSPIRNVTIDNLVQMNFLVQRNLLVTLEMKINSGDFKIIQTLENIIANNKQSTIGRFAKADVEDFMKSYSSTDDIVKKWFLQCSNFISKEINISKNGFAALWLDNIDEKEKNKLVLKNLKFDVIESNLDNTHIVYNLVEDYHSAIFKKGDLVILYPNNNQLATKNCIYKGYIKEIDSQHIYISLRNKKINKSRFLLNDYWNIELDSSDNNTKNQYNSIFELLKCDKAKQNILLGITSQEKNNNINEQELADSSPDLSLSIKEFNLNERQLKVFKQAINSKNYFFIQGPPGTGKTSYMLSSLVKYYFENTNNTILVCAYTNRAVEEIYLSITKLINKDNIMRIGMLTNSASDSILVSELSKQMQIRELSNKIDNCKIIISTTSSLYTNSEIFSLKQFDIAIIDEAAQILETQIIGIISRVQKFIMIGDECQLPAVTLQDDNAGCINDEELQSIGIYNLKNSYFERMILLLRERQCIESFGTLVDQARMHAEIMEFPNNNYYKGQLNVMYERQRRQQSLFKHNSKQLLERLLSKYRVTFIDCPIELENKKNDSEADLAIKIINIVHQKVEINNTTTLGVISPFKLQCNNIYNNLEVNLRKYITVDTVECYQGSQRDIIIISMAVNSTVLLERATSYSERMDIDRKLNVALTRAKEHIVMLGNANILSSNSDYNKFIDYCKLKGSYIDMVDIMD
ncbi:MAG TPA: AAA domain-containing protein [Candidatus Kapabacteria bacterium]|nr:AAA domain-containing protein [Candidatus Kapabacteria bacterium]